MNHFKLKYLLISAVCIFMISCSEEPGDLEQTNLTPLNPLTADISLTLTTDSIPANGTATAEFILSADTSISKYYTNVVFTASNGALFSNGSATLNATLDNNGEARALVHSTTTGTAVITASITNLVTKSQSVYFVRSYPEQLLIVPAVGTMPSGFSSTAGITAKLLRVYGSVSEGTFVNFYDSTDISTSVGTFLNITTSNNSGEATATYAIQDTSYHGFVYIKGTVTTGSGQVIRGFNKILIQ